MITDEEFERLVGRLLETLAPMLGVELEEGEVTKRKLKSTEIRDKYGVVHDLNDLVGQQCVIDTGESIYMSVQGDCTVGSYWASNNASRHDSRGLAELIWSHSHDKCDKVTVYEF